MGSYGESHGGGEMPIDNDPPLSQCPEPIAICGMGCRWPGGVSNTSQLWDLLKEKRSGFSEFSPDRINVDGFYHPNGQRIGSMYTKGGYTLAEDTKNFDHTFFGMSATETLSLDPSQRKLLEVTYEAFENAGETWDSFSGSKTGVFVGNFNSDHKLMTLRDTEHTLPYGGTGGGDTILSNRINYVFNLLGPSMTIDTACSASLYALHLATSALRNGECNAAIVAGSNMMLGPDMQMFITKLGALSPTSQCHTFDASADGYGRGEGVGAIYLKRLSDAVAAGDPIRAVVRGTAFNANGRTGGISHPSPEGQEAVIRQAYKAAGGLDPSLTGYFECHGTGTPVGDPIEVAALGRVFADTRKDEPLLIGSVKTNLGHSEAASALSQLMKAVLAIEHEEIPATIGIKNLNPAIDFEGAKAKVVQEMTSWPTGTKRRVSINSFGYGGANAHAIIEHPAEVLPNYRLLGLKLTARRAHMNGIPTPMSNSLKIDIHYSNGNRNGVNGQQDGDCGNGMKADGNDQHTADNISYATRMTCPDLVQSPIAGTREHVLLAFAGHDDQSLKANIAATAEAIDDYDLADLAYTLSAKKSRFSRRAYAIADAKSPLLAFTSAPLASGKTPGTKAQRIGFVFTGQGAQWPEMGAKLIHEYQVFRDTIRYLDNILQKLSRRPNWTMESALLEPKETSRVMEPEFSQTVCTGLQIALVSLLKTWGIECVATVGHSSGEMAAAYSAGRLSASEAIIFAYFRGQAVSRNQKDGRMMAVGIGPDQIKPYLVGLEQDVKIGAVNSPDSVTLSGETETIMSLSKKLDDQKVFNRVLKTGGTAYHSHHMAALGESFEQESSQGLRELSADIFAEPVQALGHWSSSVTPGKHTTHPTPSYWRQNLESPVLFSQAVQALATDTQVDLLIEIGPHPALGGPLRQTRSSLEQQGIKLPLCLGTLRRGEHDVTSMLTLAGTLFLLNAPVNLVAVNATEREFDGHLQLRHGNFCIDMSQYKYNYPEKPIYYENRFNKEYRTRKHPRHDLLGVRVPGGSKSHPSWRNVLRIKDLPWLEDHKLLPHAVLPGAGYIAMAVEAVRQFHHESEEALPIKVFKLRNVAINSTLNLRDDDIGTETVLNMERVALTNTDQYSKWCKFTIGSIVPDGVWIKHCNGQISVETTSTPSPLNLTVDSRARDLEIDPWYDKFSEKGLGYGPTFHGLSWLRAYHGSNSAAADVDLEPTSGNVKGGESYYPLHPATIDACFQLAIIACHAGQVDAIEKAFVPVVADQVSIWMPELVPTVSAQGEAVAVGEKRGLRGAYVQAQLKGEFGEPLMTVGELKLVAYEGTQNLGGQELIRDPYVRSVAKVDVDSLSGEAGRKLFPASTELGLRRKLRQFDRMCTYVVAGLSEHQVHELAGSRGHDKFLEWARSWVKQARTKGLPYELDAINSSAAERSCTIRKLSEELHDMPEARCIKLLHDNIKSILDDETNSVKLLLESGMLESLFSEGIGVRKAYRQLQNIIDLLAHKNPRMRILEIGGGMGGATKCALETLGAKSSLKRFESYTFTDKAGWYLPIVQANLAGSNAVSYQTFDVGADLAEPDIGQDYDLIIAPASLSQSRDLKKAITNAKKLLKPHGKLLLLEQTKERLGFDMLKRTMAGDWYPGSRMWRGHEGWSDILRKGGFSGLDVVLDDYVDDLALTSVMLTTVAEPVPTFGAKNKSQLDVYLLYRGVQSDLGHAIQWQLAGQGINGIHAELLRDTIPQGAGIISLLDISGVTLTSCDQAHFTAMQNAILRASTLLWLSPGSSISGHKPESSIMKAVLRSVATENNLMKIGHVELDRDYSHSLLTTAKIIAGKARQLYAAAPGDETDREFSLSKDLVHIERLLPDTGLNAAFQLQHGCQPEPTLLPLANQLPLRACYKQPGVLSSFYFKADTAFDEPLDDAHVEFQTSAIGLNLKDVAVATGKFDSDFLSLEASGIVTKTGREVTNLAVGDKVFGIVPGNMGNYMRSPASLLQKVKSGTKMHSAASMPIAYATALYALKDLGRLQPGESVLIQAATGGLGMASIRIAKHLGAEIYATVGNDDKRRVLIDEFGIPPERIFHSRELSAVDDIMRATNDYGIDVILGSAPGDMMHETWRCVAPLGRFIDVGRTAVLGGGQLAMEVFKRNATFSSFDLQLVAKQKPGLVSTLLIEIRKLWDQGVVGPIDHIKTYDVSKIEEAMMYFAKGSHTGKVVISYEDPTTKLMILPTLPRATLDPDAAYLLVGCLGGLGRSLATWMIERGARHLSFLSRSGADKPEAAALLSSLKTLGAETEVIRCSVTDTDAVSSALHELNATRPLKGVVHAAMVEGDSSFPSATHSQFLSVLGPKVTGSRNLAAATANIPLDFFLMTSSIVATVGTATQAAYCAANAFQDALARSMRAGGPMMPSRPALSLALGVVLEVGSVSFLLGWLATLQRTTTYGIHETELLRLVEGALVGLTVPSITSTSSTEITSHKNDPLSAGHLILGLEPSRYVPYVSRNALSDLSWHRDARFSGIVQAIEDRAMSQSSGPTAGAADSIAEQVKTAGTEKEKRAIVKAALIGKIAHLLGMEEDEIDTTQPLLRYGVDSMVAAEVRGWLGRTFGVEVGLVDLLGRGDGATVEGLTGRVVGGES